MTEQLQYNGKDFALWLLIRGVPLVAYPFLRLCATSLQIVVETNWPTRLPEEPNGTNKTPPKWIRAACMPQWKSQISMCKVKLSTVILPSTNLGHSYANFWASN